MAWKDTLLDAMFRGVPFDCIDTDESIEKSITTFEYPYVDGGEPWDLGARPMQISINAIFFGDDYEQRLAKFREVALKPGVGELVHPVWGSLTAQLTRLQVKHNAEAPDACTVALGFVEHKVTQRVFAAKSARQSAEAIGDATGAVRDASLLSYLRTMQRRLRGITSLPALMASRNEMSDIAVAIRLLSPRSLLSGASAFDNPLGFVTDLRSALASLIDFPSAASFGIGDWRGQKTAYTGVNTSGVASNTLAAPLRSATDDLIVRERSVALADVAMQVLALEADSPSLTPDEVEQIANDARGELLHAMTSARSVLPLEEHHAISDQLKNTAWQIQDAAQQVLARRPPLITRTAPGDCNLRLLAHWWYADHNRAPELLRLNPQLRYPSLITQGTTLNAYAR